MSNQFGRCHRTVNLLSNARHYAVILMSRVCDKQVTLEETAVIAMKRMARAGTLRPNSLVLN